MDYMPKDDDVIITSYPKTGTTWLQYIVLQIISRGEYFPAFDDSTYKVVPFMEMAGIDAVEALDSKPRIYKHHIPYDLVQKNDKSKFIYIYRNPEDIVVSFYHFTRAMHLGIKIDFNEFVEGFVTGNISYGNYFHHILSFYEHRDDDNLLMVSYEKLHANQGQEILRIANFLGKEYHQCLLENEEILSKVIEHTTFQYMKKNLFLSYPSGTGAGDHDSSFPGRTKVDFFRKGIVGDGKNALTDEQRERIKEVAQNVLEGTSVLEEWYSK